MSGPVMVMSGIRGKQTEPSASAATVTLIKVNKPDISNAKKNEIFLQINLYFYVPLNVSRIWCNSKTVFPKLCCPSDMHIAYYVYLCILSKMTVYPKYILSYLILSFSRKLMTKIAFSKAKKLQQNFLDRKWLPPPPFGNFPEIHRYWKRRASLISNRAQLKHAIALGLRSGEHVLLR